jgi:anti-sigma regulatory factor (Ser/Thr protein kinase)
VHPKSPAEGTSEPRHDAQVNVPDLELKLIPENDQSRVLRARLREWCSDEGLPEPQVDDLVLVASELFSNAVRATVGEAPITAGFERQADGTLVRMVNEGSGFDPAQVAPPAPDRVGGRGISIAKALGTLAVAQRRTTTTVTVLVQ